MSIDRWRAINQLRLTAPQHATSLALATIYTPLVVVDYLMKVIDIDYPHWLIDMAPFLSRSTRQLMYKSHV